jgi:hypothetical protein
MIQKGGNMTTKKILLKCKFKDYADVLNRLGYKAVYINEKGERTKIEVTHRFRKYVFYSRRAVYDFLTGA